MPYIVIGLPVIADVTRQDGDLVLDKTTGEPLRRLTVGGRDGFQTVIPVDIEDVIRSHMPGRVRLTVSRYYSKEYSREYHNIVDVEKA